MGSKAAPLVSQWSAKLLTICYCCTAFAQDSLGWNPSSINTSSYVTLDLSLYLSGFSLLICKMRITMVLSHRAGIRVLGQQSFANRQSYF